MPLGFHWIFANIDSVNAHTAGCRLHDPADDLDGGRLTGAVRPDKTEDFPLPDSQGQVVKGGKRYIFFGDLGQLNHDFTSFLPTVRLPEIFEWVSIYYTNILSIDKDAGLWVGSVAAETVFPSLICKR